jgi:hypothetical protein
MNKDQLMLESIYMEITNLIQGNFGGDRYKKEALDVFRKYGEVREGDEVEGEDALVIAMLYNVAGDDWEYFEDLNGNVIITRFDSEDPDSNIIHRDFGNEEEFNLDDIMKQAENNVTLTPKEFVEYIHNVL